MYRYHNYYIQEFSGIHLSRKRPFKSYYLAKVAYFIPLYLLLIYNADVFYNSIYRLDYFKKIKDKKIRNKTIVENIIKYNNAPKNDPIKYFSQF